MTQTRLKKIISASPQNILKASALLHDDELVAFPTETVYGLGGNACSSLAVASIYQAKNRPRFNPLIIHIASLEEAVKLAHFNELALKCARHFWPGALTLVLKRKKNSPICALSCAGGDTIALRVPAHKIALALLRQSRLPIAAPSANPSQYLSPTTAHHVEQGLGDRVDMILDGGATDIGVESTIIGCFDDRLFLLRSGAIAQQDIEAIAQKPCVKGQKESSSQTLTQPWTDEKTLRTMRAYPSQRPEC